MKSIKKPAFAKAMAGEQIKNLKKAAEKIKRAIKNKEKIILYGDADLDGMASVIILKEAIKNFDVYHQVVHIYFPDMETEDYGLNEDALIYLKKYAAALLVILDCGIGNLKKAKMANKLGFEVIIIDHHVPLKKLPQASIIVNPKQKGDKYPFKEFANAGLVFRLIEVLLKRKLSASLKETVPPGLRVFWQLFGEDSSSQAIAQKIISACHAGGTRNHLNEGYLLLTATSLKEAESAAKDLLEKAALRQAKIKEVTGEIEQRLGEEVIIFEGDEFWPVLMLGPAASRIIQSQKKPVFLYNYKNGYCQGAVRTPPGIDGVKAMAHCSK